MTIVCGVAVLISSIILFNREINEAAYAKVNTAKSVVEHEIDRMKEEVRIAALGMANNQSLIEALRSEERYLILQTAQELLSMTSLDYCTVRDGDGRVIALTHDPDFYGEDATAMPHIVSAYIGRTEGQIVQGITIPLAVSAGAPVYDGETIIGVVALGYRFDNQELVHSLRNLTGCEITFFSDDERISSTLLNEDEAYVLGTHIDPDLGESVLSGNQFIGTVQLFNRSMIASYSPLYNANNEILGMVFTGYYTDEEASKLVFFVGIGTLATIIVIVLCVFLARLLSIHIENRIATLEVYKVKEEETSLHLDYSKKLADVLSTITKSPDIPAGDVKAAAEIIASEACKVLNIHRISIWSLSEAEDALVNITCYERSTGEHSVQEDFDLLDRVSYANLLRSERLIITSNIYESADVDDGFNPEICAMLEAPIRLDGKLIGLVCADLDRCEEFPEEREWLTEEQNFVSSLADLMALSISGFERRKAHEEADIANQAKSSFLANMSHEIRTPMNSILGVTDILMQKELLPADIEDGLSRIYTSCDMLLGIINDILDFSKIEAGKLDILPAQYKTASLINDSVQLNMTRIYGKPIEFEVQVDENVPAKLIGDELRIKQILNNLLSNAFKYTDSGKVTLSVVSDSGPGDEFVTLVLIVRDTGQGMTRGQLSRLFDEYSRFTNDFNSAIEGTGLGLAITNRLISLMNGGIQVESEPGVGSMFAVRLPQKYVDSDVVGNQVAENLRQFRMNYVVRSRRGQVAHNPMPYGSILVVDDFEANLYVAEGLMKPYGLQIDKVQSGLEAIEKIKSGKVYDVIFMDHMMPDLDGIETTGYLRSFGYNEPIVALTANAVAGQADVFLEKGFDDFISKPIDIRNLDLVLNKYIRDKQPPEVIKAAEDYFLSRVGSKDTQTEKDSNDELNERFNEENRTNATYESLDEEPEVSSPSSKRLIDRKIEGLDIVAGLDRYYENEIIYLKVLRSYVASVRPFLDTIEAFDKDKIIDYKIKVHGIKGASLDIQAISIGKSADDLEYAAKVGDVDFIDKNNPAFVEQVRKMVNDLENLFTAINLENPKPLKDKPDSDDLLRLLNACKEYNTNEADDIMTEIDKYKYSSESALVDWLRDNVDMMNFSQIAERLSNNF